jgi:hypothetical protein
VPKQTLIKTFTGFKFKKRKAKKIQKKKEEKQSITSGI